MEPDIVARDVATALHELFVLDRNKWTGGKKYGVPSVNRQTFNKRFRLYREALLLGVLWKFSEHEPRYVPWLDAYQDIILEGKEPTESSKWIELSEASKDLGELFSKYKNPAEWAYNWLLAANVKSPDLDGTSSLWINWIYDLRVIGDCIKEFGNKYGPDSDPGGSTTSVEVLSSLQKSASAAGTRMFASVKSAYSELPDAPQGVAAAHQLLLGAEALLWPEFDYVTPASPDAAAVQQTDPTENASDHTPECPLSPSDELYPVYQAYAHRDFATAAKLLRPLAERGNASAEALLACLYAAGDGVPKDDGRALNWCRRAAEQGEAGAQCVLSIMYFQGNGVAQDFEEAIKWLRKSAEQGLAWGQNNLGVMYARGQGVRQDYKEAVKWYHRAAEQGYAPAQFNLGTRYSIGEGIKRDNSEAIRWFRKAAEQGDAASQFALAGAYMGGYGLRRNYVQAYTWVKLAAAGGFKDAEDTLEPLSKRLSRAQVSEANQRAAAWRAAPVRKDFEPPLLWFTPPTPANEDAAPAVPPVQTASSDPSATEAKVQGRSRRPASTAQATRQLVVSLVVFAVIVLGLLSLVIITSTHTGRPVTSVAGNEGPQQSQNSRPATTTPAPPKPQSAAKEWPILPDNVLTPGAVASTDQKDVCGIVNGQTYSQRHLTYNQRHPDGIPVELGYVILSAYGLNPTDQDAVIDHRVPICVGGADVRGNLWPEPGWGRWNYHDKDRLEEEVCRRVCRAHSLSLKAGQAIFLGDWAAGYRRVFGGDPPDERHPPGRAEPEVIPDAPFQCPQGGKCAPLPLHRGGQ